MAALDLQRPGSVLLDTSLQQSERRSLLFTSPERRLVARSLDEVPELLREIDHLVRAGKYVAGYIGYEAGYAFEPIADPGDVSHPLMWFGVYTAPQHLAPDTVEAMLAETTDDAARLYDVQFDLTRRSYGRQFRRVKALIHRGDVYQINLTGKVRFGYERHPLALYRRLREQQRVRYGAYLNIGNYQILSFSPELFFRREGAQLTTRPMKGTVHRGATAEEDEMLRQRLSHDAKSRAENLMIVDLLRNDLSRCCRPGSVHVPALFEVESYETVTQMTSTVTGELREECGYADIFRALFPCGSVTGAPKIRAMKRIRAIEAGPRGVYCGSIGYIGPDREATFNVSIRTLLLQDGRGEMGTGGGIVWDSDEQAEYEECRLKARFLEGNRTPGQVDDMRLIETLRVEDGTVPLLERHLARLRRSARHFGFALDEDVFRKEVLACAAATDAGCFKLRVTLSRESEITSEANPIPCRVDDTLAVMLARERVSSRDPWLRHKTTSRALYERAYAAAQRAGYDEAILLNERGEITEGTRSNVFIEVNGRLYTPPLRCGLLPGVYREMLLEEDEAEERVLYPEDLRRADTLYCCNAVRGMQSARLVSASTLSE